MSMVLTCCCFRLVATSGGIPHEAALSAAYLISLASAAEKVLNNPQASFGSALRSLAARIAPAFFCASSRSLPNSVTQGGSCCGAAFQGDAADCCGTGSHC